MTAYPEPWALVLAAGEGSRLRALTTDPTGQSIPKQFCSLNGGASLLQLALQRATRVARWGRTVTIVAEQHEAWWRNELAFATEDNVVVQSRNRGTAVGILLPLLHIVSRDPEARVVFLPSDHYVADEDVLARSMREALAEVNRRPEHVVLLGIVPDEPDGDFGWIMPVHHGEGGIQRVRRFVEKPPRSVATELMRKGGMWNSFIMAATGETLLDLFTRKLSAVVATLWKALAQDFATQPRSGVLASVYEQLDSHDFCRDVLEGCEDRLSVLPVPACGWSDLGTPDRVAHCVEQMTGSVATTARLRLGAVTPNLSQATRHRAAASRA
jgi:mannose-1-phosphate guanylyltransferase